MDTEHTPWPWTIRITAGTVPLYLIEQERVDENRSPANAVLMEAAPLMLEALQRLVAILNSGAVFGSPGWIAAIIDVHDAIAAATENL